MSASSLRRMCLLAFLLCAASATAQEGHPARGVWVGNWGPALTAQSRIVVVFDHDGKALSGVFNPGPNAAPLKAARMDITLGTPSPKRGVPAILPIFKIYLKSTPRMPRGTRSRSLRRGPSRTWRCPIAGSPAPGPRPRGVTPQRVNSRLLVSDRVMEPLASQFSR
jgi:hypothetical protein